MGPIGPTLLHFSGFLFISFLDMAKSTTHFYLHPTNFENNFKIYLHRIGFHKLFIDFIRWNYFISSHTSQIVYLAKFNKWYFRLQLNTLNFVLIELFCESLHGHFLLFSSF